MYPVGLVLLSWAASGDIDRALVKRVVHSVTPLLKTCFERRPHDSGRVSFRFVIAEDGSVPEASVVSSEIEDDDMLACMTAALKKMKFPPHTGGPFTIRYPFRFVAAQKPSAPALLQKRPPAATVQNLPDQLRASEIRDGMERIKPAIAACHRRHHEDRIVTVDVTIQPDGSVSNAVADDPRNPTVDCVVTAVRSARFPHFGGPMMTIEYPLVVGTVKRPSPKPITRERF